MKKLINTVTSFTKKDKKTVVYGMANEQVSIIREYGNVFIVENKKGERFPIKEDNLK